MSGLVGLGTVLLGAFVVRALTGFGGASMQQLCATWISDAIALSAAAVCLWRAASERRDRAVWGFAGLGVVAWGLGNAYFEHMLASGASLPNPSPADIGYLCFYPLMYLAVIAARRDGGQQLGVGGWLDGLIGGAACATLGAAFALEPVLQATEGESLAGALTNIAYPIGDLTLLAMLVVTTATVGWRAARGLTALAIGMAIFALSDTIYIVQNANGDYRVGGVLDAGWLIALMLIAIGAGAQGRTGAATVAPRRAVVPSIAGLVALAVLGLQPLVDLSTSGLVIAVLTLTLVITRLAVSLRETAGLLETRAREAALDPLTGLGNRRLLLADLSAHALDATTERPVLLVLFDLDGFKVYNDTFGHIAGDNLLIEVASGLQDVIGERGRAYRIGGDEFCALLSPVHEASTERICVELAEAMARHGEGFSVTASYGCASAPADGRETTALLRCADDEMYARKGRRRPGTESQVQDALIAALSARDPELGSQATSIAELAAALGRGIGLGASDLRALTHAAALHDIGKIAIPESILDKPAELDPEERRFVQTHPLIAQRIISAAPALGYAAQIVRSAQERWDGTGYPDGLRGDAIPIASRIVGICGAYHAMTRNRPSRKAMSAEEAVAELRRCSRTQFDPNLVTMLIEILRNPAGHSARESPTPAQVADLLVSREVDGRRRLEAQLSYQSDHDLLTGLLNRWRFAEELERMLRYTARYRRAGALLMLDLDNLKLVNDVHGHAAGDDALKLVTREIRGRTRGTDAVARLGGDEFAIALHEASRGDALAVAKDIHRRLGECGIDPPIQISIGIALFEGDQELVADDLLTAADIALYEAKEAGRGKTRIHHGEATGALGWVKRIRGALAEKRFVLYGQPIVDLRSGATTHHELLIRMLSDDGDVIPPAAFIPTAERFGLIGAIDRWVVREGLQLALDGERVSINLSAHSIGDPDILEDVRTAAREGLARNAVIFELTETAAMTNMQVAREFIEELGSLGCDVALDDFGTGFGSFSYLKHLPTSYLKIDVEFVRDLSSNLTDRHVVRSITDIGHSLGKRIIAEGVEDQATVQALREYGVDFAQGSHIGDPQSITPSANEIPRADSAASV
ncbi:MAG TPA: diguanylate cyclase [Solirubrobacteraceae bacterium]|jgi:diguanylate cyclase (GGDEF)-like protein